MAHITADRIDAFAFRLPAGTVPAAGDTITGTGPHAMTFEIAAAPSPWPGFPGSYTARLRDPGTTDPGVDHVLHTARP